MPTAVKPAIARQNSTKAYASVTVLLAVRFIVLEVFEAPHIVDYSLQGAGVVLKGAYICYGFFTICLKMQVNKYRTTWPAGHNNRSQGDYAIMRQAIISFTALQVLRAPPVCKPCGWGNVRSPRKLSPCRAVTRELQSAQAGALSHRPACRSSRLGKARGWRPPTLLHTYGSLRQAVTPEQRPQ